MKKTLSCMLLAALLLSAFASCSSGDGGSGETIPAADTTASTTETESVETEPEKLTPDLPDRDFEGYTYRGLVRGYIDSHWYTRDFYAEELTGEPINDAVYNRNAAVSDRFNVKIEQLDGKSLGMEGYARKTVQAGVDAMDVVLGTSALNTLITDGILVDLKSVPYIDLEKPWYDQNSIASLSIANKVYVTAAEINIMDKDATWCVLFNKDMAQDLSLGDYYQMVHDGTWTQDVMLTGMEAASIDVNGNGERDADDQWGNVGEDFDTMGYMVASGARCFTKDENDLPKLSVLDERYVDSYTKAMAINGNFDLCMYASKFGNDWSILDSVFTEGRCLFSFVGMNRVTLFREMEADFGILPAPKYDEAQDSYYNVISCGNATFVSIPKSVQDLERTGIITEALCAESLYTLTPAYYDITLKTKAARDEESSAMLDIIFANRVFELGNFWGWGGIFDVPGAQSYAGKSDIVSAVEKKVSTAEKAMQKTIDAVLENNG